MRIGLSLIQPFYQNTLIIFSSWLLNNQPVVELVRWIVSLGCPDGHTNHFDCCNCNVSVLIRRANRLGGRAAAACPADGKKPSETPPVRSSSEDEWNQEGQQMTRTDGKVSEFAVIAVAPYQIEVSNRTTVRVNHLIQEVNRTDKANYRKLSSLKESWVFADWTFWWQAHISNLYDAATIFVSLVEFFTHQWPSDGDQVPCFLTILSQTHLFVGKHKQHSIPQLILSQHSHQLFPCLTNSLSVITVHDKDEAWNWKSMH